MTEDKGLRVFADTLELANWQEQMLREIADSGMTRRDVAQSYVLAMMYRCEIDWAVVNRAIINRWSRSTLEWIKNLAWSGKAFA